MQPEKTARIQVPPTERISAPQNAENQTICMVASKESAYEEPRNESLFDQYTIYSKIGNGGMGVVYLARDRRLGRFVAIKRLNHQAQTIPTLRQRFLQEARAVAVLSHVHIVHIYALGEDDDGPFIVMEYISGPDPATGVTEPPASGLVQPNPPLTLDEYVNEHGQLTVDEAINVVLKIGRAVAYAHASGVIHRDLKPSNILMDKSGEPKIVDFGLARLMSREETKLTVPGEKLLSLGYGAPEQESDAVQSDERSDVYGLGALLYFVLTGQNPRYFREQDIPVALRELVVKALATDKEQRWESAAAFNTALHHVQTKTVVDTPTVKTTWRCKWCDAINPLAIKFCAECGWDGSEMCPECGEETFVGVQFCGNCGADARAYESVLLLLRKMREAFKAQRFDRVIAHAGRLHNFEPAGPSGRVYLQEITDLRVQADQNIRRRDQLKEQIPIEIRAENYERASEFIRQYRQLSDDRQGFESERKQIPEQMLYRDLKRAHKALKNHEWDLVSRIWAEMLQAIDPDHPEVRKIRNAIRLHAIRVNVRTVFVVLASVILVYLISLPIVVKASKGTLGRLTKGFYMPGCWIYERSFLATPLKQYGALWIGKERTLATFFKASGASAKTLEVSLPKPDELAHKQRDYERQVEEFDVSQAEFHRAWPIEYARELDLLMERCRTAGDFDGWDVVQNEKKRFEEMQQIDSSRQEDELLTQGNVAGDGVTELFGLKRKYRKMLADQRLVYSRKRVTLCKKYANDLVDLQRNYMQDGKMDLASAVNAEIRKTKTDPRQLAAEAAVSAAELAGMSNTEAPQVLLSDGRAEEIAQKRVVFEKELAEVEETAAKKAAEWPEKYIQNLTDLMEAFQRAGDFAGWESARSEMSRFEADRAILQRHLVLEPSALMALQKKFFLIREENRRVRAESILATTEKYVKKLQELQKRLTVAGQMDTAALVNAEIKRVRTRIDYLDAQNELSPQGPPVPPEVWQKNHTEAKGEG